MYISYEKILDQINGIQKGDIVYVVSDVLELAKVTLVNGEFFNKNVFLDTIMDKIGREGTLLIPTFNWGFCQGKTFDYKKTPSEAGALGNAALKRNDFKRTKHPIYSFCVWGRDSDNLFEMDPVNSFGKGTIFEYIVNNHAKALIIDLPTMRGNVICHHMEQIVGVPFRFEKTFTADYVDWNGKKSKKEYTMYVRYYEMEAKERLAPMNSILETLGITETDVINGIPFRVCDEARAAGILYQDMKYNDCRCTYEYKGQKNPIKHYELYHWEDSNRTIGGA